MKIAHWRIVAASMLSVVAVICVDRRDETRDQPLIKEREHHSTEGFAPTHTSRHRSKRTIDISGNDRQLVRIDPPRPDVDDQKVLDALLDEGMTQQRTEELLKISHETFYWGGMRYRVISYKSPIVPNKVVDVVYERYETDEFVLGSWKCRTPYSARFLRDDPFIPVAKSDGSR